MSCERQIPYAVMNWRILIEEDFFFVDHTRYLHDPNWSHGRNVEVVIVEVGGNRGYNWFEVEVRSGEHALTSDRLRRAMKVMCPHMV